METKNTEQFFLWVRGIFALSFAASGLYFELGSAIVSMFMIVLLIAQAKRFKVSICLNGAFLTVCCVSLLYFISSFWAVDSGLALWGGVKYLPLPLCAVCLMQLSQAERRILLLDIPQTACILTILAMMFSLTPKAREFLWVNGRFGGFFQYPNAYACFLLIGLCILFLSSNHSKDLTYGIFIQVITLSLGLLLTQSRSILLLSVPFIFVLLYLKRNKKQITLFISGLFLSGIVFYGIFQQYAINTSHLSELSTHTSTLLGRLLYWKDALRVVICHPFGLGYLGYYFTQGSFQTGVYTVRWVHNDLLQLMLDIGWFPAILVMIVVIKSFLFKKTSSIQRLTIALLFFHSMVDFDFEFVVMYFILLLCFDWDISFNTQTIEIDSVSWVFIPISTFASIFALYIGIISFMTDYHITKQAATLYPWNTLSDIALLSDSDDIEEAQTLSQKILAQNQAVAPAWEISARYAFEHGDFGKMIQCKRKAIQFARYSVESYIEYFEMLKLGAELYIEAQDSKSAEICINEIKQLDDWLKELETETDRLAWEIGEVPQLSMTEDYYFYLEQIK